MRKDYRRFVYDENQRFIYPTSDWGFKHLFATEANKDILIGVLNHLLPGSKIRDLTYLTRDVTIPVGKMKDATFDVFCELEDGSRVVVEMQNYARRSFLDRSLVYTSAAVLEQFINGRSGGYSICRTVFVAFTGDVLYGSAAHSPVRIGLCDVDAAATTVLNDKLLQIFVELPKFAGSLEGIDSGTPFVEKLAYVLMEMPHCSEMPSNLDEELLRRIFEASDTSRFNDMEKREYKSAIMSEFDYEVALGDAKLDGLEEGREEGKEIGFKLGLTEGRELGINEGRELGLTEGRELGINEGRELGRKEINENLAAAMKIKGLPLVMIAELTGLQIQAIEKL